MPYIAETPESPNAIRKFTQKGIESAMNAALANLPTGKRGAVVMYADKEGVHGAVYGRKPGKFFGLLPAGEWSYVGTIGSTYKGALTAGAAVAYSW